jgi:hypothetical protein
MFEGSMNLTPRMHLGQLKVYGHKLHSINVLIILFPLVFLLWKFSSILLFLSKGDQNGHGRSWFLQAPLLVLLMHFLFQWSSS